MSNRLKVTLISITVIAVLSAFGIFYLVNNSNNGSDKSTLTEGQYYVQKGIENFAKIAKPAVENFLNQDKSESVDSRSARLKKYFTSDSPVYGYGLANLAPSYHKTTAKLTSVVVCEGDEGVCLKVMVTLSIFSDEGNYSIPQTYTLTLTDSGNGVYKPVDMEAW